MRPSPGPSPQGTKISGIIAEAMEPREIGMGGKVKRGTGIKIKPSYHAYVGKAVCG